jgi:anti-sigma regulatory factor (Ser/Thr protein kinase)
MTGIYELLLNAIEHGNLDIGYDLKATLIHNGQWMQEIERRLAQPEYAKREVDIRLIRDKHICCLTISDMGKGFPWQKYVRTLSCGRRPNGRGLWIAFNSNFDHITFSPTGNAVTCVAKYGH